MTQRSDEVNHGGTQGHTGGRRLYKRSSIWFGHEAESVQASSCFLFERGLLCSSVYPEKSSQSSARFCQRSSKGRQNWRTEDQPFSQGLQAAHSAQNELWILLVHVDLLVISQKSVFPLMELLIPGGLDFLSGTDGDKYNCCFVHLHQDRCSQSGKRNKQTTNVET